MTLRCAILFTLASLLSLISFQQEVSMRAWVQEGYYYSHRCEVTIQIVSNYFESKYQLFHVLSKQNANFFTTIEYSNVFYIKGTNQMQAVMTSSETYCKFPMSSTYYCPFISVSGYDPYGLKYYEPVNATHNKLTIRLARPICPQQGKVMSFRIQMPTSSDYSQFYMFVPDITNTTLKTVDKLSFVYDQQVTVNLSKLQYKQVRSINSIPQNVFLVGCQFRYPITFRFDNASYFNSWDEINVYVSNLSLVQLSTTCQSNITVGYSCTKTSYGYRMVNSNQSNMVKSYEIADQEYFQYQPLIFNMQFGLQFISQGQLTLQIVVKANNNSYQQSWLNMSHNSSQIYGRKIFVIDGYNEKQFVLTNEKQFVLTNQGSRYDPLKCITPIYISNSTTTIPNQNGSSIVQNTTTTTNGSSTNGSTTNNNNTNTNTTTNTTTTNNTTTNSTNNTTPNNTTPSNNNNNTYTPPENDFQFDITTSSFQISQLIFILSLISVLSVTLLSTKSIRPGEKMLYLITIFFLSVIKVLYLILQVDQGWLKISNTELTDSLINSSTHTYSLQLFILKYTFLFQFLLNILYFFNYLILILCSQQIHQRIKKFYGAKKYVKNTLDHIQNKVKINQCNLSSVIFTFISVLSFLMNFKIYSLLILKLQIDVHPPSSEFKKYRFRNSVLYKIHAGHLGIDLLLESNTLIWLFMTIKSCQNEIFTYFLWIILVFYCIHVYLVAVVLKVFILMGKRTDQINLEQRNRIKQSSLNLQPYQHDFDEKQPEINQNIQQKNDNITDRDTLKIESKLSEKKEVKSPNISSLKSSNSKLKKNSQFKK